MYRSKTTEKRRAPLQLFNLPEGGRKKNVTEEQLLSG
jgi:hypothetical protein